MRVRAFLPREIESGAECIVDMNPIDQSTTLLVPSDVAAAGNNDSKGGKGRRLEEKTFTFDNSFWSHNPEDKHYATQEDVYNSLGEEFLDHNFEGYHTCIFAYGQTGSGKSYTMMGTPEQPGLIPRTCEDLFQRIAAAQEETPNVSYDVRVSYFEVYNEHVRDLLVPPAPPGQPPYYLKIRESPTEGPYVKDLTEVPVRSINEILRYMRMGDASRTVASTKMNDTSSRSHAVFTIMLKQIHHDMDTDETTERSSRIRLVDLAGSERAKATEATGQRLREGSNINKSLTTLGRVIAALADPKQQQSTTRSGTPKRNGDGRRDPVVPYRDSILTWLLKDSLGGNSKTAMIACISPTDYEETLSTLRYADQAKRIRTRAVVNQGSLSSAERDAKIAAMADEIRQLQLAVGDSRRREQSSARENEERLEAYQARVAGLQRAMEERSLVAEGKIRSLQTQNDALRRHLRLALDALKNPIRQIPLSSAAASPVESPRTAKRDVGEDDADKENSRRQGRRRVSGLAAELRKSGMMPNVANKKVSRIDEAEDNGSDYDSESDGGYVSGTTVGQDDDHDDVFSRKAGDVTDHMQALLRDLSLFRRKIGDDRGRWLDSESDRQPLGERGVNV